MCGMCRESDLLMKIKTCELSGKALDFAVALIEGATYSRDFDEPVIEWTEKFDTPLRFYSPSTKWAQGGPLIEKHLIFVVRNSKNQWVSFVKLAKYAMVGLTADTPLVAAMRCLVWVALGDEVEIPDELLEN